MPIPGTVRHGAFGNIRRRAPRSRTPPFNAILAQTIAVGLFWRPPQCSWIVAKQMENLQPKRETLIKTLRLTLKKASAESSCAGTFNKGTAYTLSNISLYGYCLPIHLFSITTWSAEDPGAEPGAYCRKHCTGGR